MNKKVPLGVTIALIVVAITASIAITMEIAMHTYDNLIEDLPKREEMYSGLSELDDIVRKNYFGKKLTTSCSMPNFPAGIYRD